MEDETKLLKSRHPLASANNKSRGNVGTVNEVKSGDRVIYTPDGRHGVLDECLHDGDALVTWDGGDYGMIKWCHLVPETPPPPPPPPPPPEIDYKALMAKLAMLQPGDVLVYYTGFLAKHRTNNRKLTALAKMALDLQRQRRVRLFQRKIGDGVFDYIAVGCYHLIASDLSLSDQIKQEIADATA